MGRWAGGTDLGRTDTDRAAAGRAGLFSPERTTFVPVSGLERPTLREERLCSFSARESISGRAPGRGTEGTGNFSASAARLVVLEARHSGDTLFKFPRLQVEIGCFRVFGRVRGQRRAGSSDGPGPGGLSVSDCLLPRRVAVGLKRRSQSELPAPLPLPISRAGPPARRAQNVASAGRRPRS